MKLERTKNTIKGTFWGIFNKCFTVFVQFAIRTIIIQKLGSEYLGLSSLLTSILNVLSLAELGFGSALVYSMYKPIVEDDKQTLMAMINLYRKLYKIISAIILIIGLSIMPFLKNLINTNSLKNLDVNIHIVYFIYLMNTVLSYGLFAYKRSLLQAYQRQDIISIINSAISIILYAAQVILLLLFKDYYLYICCLPVFTIVENIITNIRVNKMYPDIKCIGNLDKKYIKAISKTTGALLGHKIGTVVINSADNIVISIFLNLTILSMYNNYYYVISALIVFIYIGYNAIVAGIGNSIITESIDKNYTLFKNLFFILSWVVGFCSICLLCLYQTFMELWMGKAYMFNMGTVGLLSLYFYLWQMRVAGLAFKDAAGMWGADFWKPYVSAIFNIIINVCLVTTIGINGVVISSILAVSVISFPWETHVLFKQLFKRKTTEYLGRHFRYGIVTLIAACITFAVCNLVPMYGFIWLIVKILICCLIPNSIFILCYFKLPEFRYIAVKLRMITNSTKIKKFLCKNEG